MMTRLQKGGGWKVVTLTPWRIIIYLSMCCARELGGQLFHNLDASPYNSGVGDCGSPNEDCP